MSAKTAHRGRCAYRIASNPEEGRFARAWAEANARHNGILFCLLNTPDASCCGRSVQPTDEQAELAATVVQWLGSPVGESFLDGLGYSKRRGGR